MDENAIKNILDRNVVEIIEKDHLEEKLKKGGGLRIKLGIDPTGPKIHLGRAIALWKLRQFQEQGHQIVLIIGDFTATVGDASDKENARPQLAKAEIKENMKHYKKQIGKILDLKKTELHYNSEWLSKIKFEELVRLASLFTVHQLVNRRNFKERFESGAVIGFHEFLYPLMQGYDSVAISADVEIGGTDQLFNFLAGRKIQEFYGQEPQDVMTLQMLEGLDARKMSTTYGNVVNITDEPNDMFGKIMSMKDDLIVKYFNLATNLDIGKIHKIEDELENAKINPFELKKELAFEIVRIYHGEKAAKEALERFINVFQKGELPKDTISFKAEKGELFCDVLVKNKMVSSRSEFRRLTKEEAVEFNGEIVKDIRFKIQNSGVAKIGKKKFVKIEILL